MIFHSARSRTGGVIGLSFICRNRFFKIDYHFSRNFEFTAVDSGGFFSSFSFGNSILFFSKFRIVTNGATLYTVPYKIKSDDLELNVTFFFPLAFNLLTTADSIM